MALTRPGGIGQCDAMSSQGQLELLLAQENRSPVTCPQTNLLRGTGRCGAGGSEERQVGPLTGVGSSSNLEGWRSLMSRHDAVTECPPDAGGDGQ